MANRSLSLARADAAQRRQRLHEPVQTRAEIYRAGFALLAAPVQPPQGLSYELFPGGKYSRFVLTGPYSDLGPATGRVFELVAELPIAMRDDFCIENYLNDPRVTPPDRLITEILIPTE